MAEQKKTGRPSKLTPETREKILAALRGGNYRHVAVAWAGIDYTTFARWLRESKADPDGPHGAFHQEVQEAETAAEIGMVAGLVKAGRDDPSHWKWWLERKFPDRWGRETRRIAELEKVVKVLEQRLEGGS